MGAWKKRFLSKINRIFQSVQQWGIAKFQTEKSVSRLTVEKKHDADGNGLLPSTCDYPRTAPVITPAQHL